MQKQISLGFAKSFPQKIVWQNRVRISPRHTVRILGGQNTKKKNVPYFSYFRGGGLFLKWKRHFSFGVAE